MTKISPRRSFNSKPVQAQQPNFQRHYDQFDMEAEREAMSIRRAGELRPSRSPSRSLAG